MNANTDGMKKAVKCARGLGWFSIGLGAMELLLPGKVGWLIGIRNHKKLIRWMGVREISSGITVLVEEKPVLSMAGRVTGDAVDLSLLGAGFSSRGASKGRLGTAVGVVAGITALDSICMAQLAKGSGPVSTTQTVSVNKTPEECYQFWRDFENLPRFMEYLKSVRVTGEKQSHWIAKAPAGTTMEWDAELIQDSPNRIEWKSLPGADVDNTGTVEFQNAPAGHGTIIKATIEYRPPAGEIGAAVAKLFGHEPGMQAKSDLRRFKAVMEAGEVPTITGQSSGRTLSST